MTFKGTKGEWVCSSIMNFSGTLVSFIESKTCDKSISQLRGCKTGQEDEAYANATLISASPDLYDALNEALVELNAQYVINPNPLLKIRIDQASDALSKACGENIYDNINL